MAYPKSDRCCGCAESMTAAVLIIIYSLLRAVGPMVYLLLPVCRDVHGGSAGSLLLVLKLLEVATTIIHIVVGIALLITLNDPEASRQEAENCMRLTFVYMTIVVASLLILYWVIHFINACAAGCTFCSDYGGSANSDAPFTLKNGYNERMCKKWKSTNNTGYILLATFPLFAVVEGALLFYFASVVNGLEY